MRSPLTRRWRVFSGVLALFLLVVPAFAETYTVKSGDTLNKIAHDFSISISELLASNQYVHAEQLTIGQVLALPQKVEATQPALPQPSQVMPLEIPPLNDPRVLALQRARLLAAERGQQLAATAQNFLGVPYRWAGTTSRGLDCSGLVLRSMAVLGKNVPHNAAALYKLGQRVSYEELQPGDLVFFNTRGRGVSHVGIWIGDNTFVHASTSRGVIRQEMKGYYARRLVGACRINP